MSARYTKASIRAAMMELVCQGQEGHRPKDYKPQKSPLLFHVSFTCEKCKRTIDVRDMDLNLEESDDDFSTIPDPRATIPFGPFY